MCLREEAGCCKGQKVDRDACVVREHDKGRECVFMCVGREQIVCSGRGVHAREL